MIYIYRERERETEREREIEIDRERERDSSPASGLERIVLRACYNTRSINTMYII